MDPNEAEEPLTLVWLILQFKSGRAWKLSADVGNSSLTKTHGQMAFSRPFSCISSSFRTDEVCSVAMEKALLSVGSMAWESTEKDYLSIYLSIHPSILKKQPYTSLILCSLLRVLFFKRCSSDIWSHSTYTLCWCVCSACMCLCFFSSRQDVWILLNKSSLIIGY